VGALYERKRLRDAEQAHRRELERQREIAQNLLLNILPARVALELSQRGAVDPMYFEDATIVFTDFAGFTLSTEQLPADELVALLDRYFSAFDEIIGRYGLEKLKTIGDSYMFAGGLPERNSSHPVDAILACFEILDAARTLANSGLPAAWDVRIGVHTGPVIAGIVGRRKFAFDVWGDTVNLASRMESSGEPNRVNISAITFARVKDFFACERRGQVKTKDGRHIEMYFANTVAPGLLRFAAEQSRPKFWQRYTTYFGKEPAGFPAAVPVPREPIASTHASTAAQGV
jgi:class 3 adenylate cyclase